ncbi:hypothetical protein [Coxiella endosymbiont of Ornithodoros maritimus]|uniref:hypothetical protein n=1 Tax=Coxiella endosymbiont of Ornithodoros maritimus TaxID=1656172 RepID=UPI002263F1BF|nr:hypothetical protein [Coxiella endosymbiont of Ornithodoros maritimus]
MQKALYSKVPAIIQACIRYTYIIFLLLDHWIKGNNPFKFIKNYKIFRGMFFIHDMHDWLGGYPYKSITLQAMKEFSNSIGFYVEKQKIQGHKISSAIFGSACDEYVLKNFKT